MSEGRETYIVVLAGGLVDCRSQIVSTFTERLVKISEQKSRAGSIENRETGGF